MKRLQSLVLASSLLFAFEVVAQPIKVGVSVSMTGPAASLGIPEGNTARILPKTIGGQAVEYIILDDGSDTTKGVANLRKLATDEKVDVIVGPTTTPVSLAAVEVASELKLPIIALGGSSKITDPVDDKRRWVFKTPQSDSLIVNAMVTHMKKTGIKSAAFIGFNDAYGDGWVAEFTAAFKAQDIKFVAAERYARTDTSVLAQILKIVGENPDAVVIGASGTPAALPAKALKSRQYAGKVYVGHGAANNDFLRIGGVGVEGILMATGPILVADQLPDSNPTKKISLAYVKEYNTMFGANTANAFGAYMYDAYLLLQAAIPQVKAKPGSQEFREGLRSAIENVREMAGTHAVYNMSPTDHTGHDHRAAVMVTVENGAWKLID